jgi:hypothetical protein
MSYNIRYDNTWDVENSWRIRRNKVSQILIQYAPSIIGIQEGLLNQVQYIDSCLINYEYVGIGRDDGKEKGEFCAIYYDTTRYALLKHSTFWLSETPDTISVGWDAVCADPFQCGIPPDRYSIRGFRKPECRMVQYSKTGCIKIYRTKFPLLFAIFPADPHIFVIYKAAVYVLYLVE